MSNLKSGFTLMEIMVVIIIIAVLASVAGPMITGITDQGKASATKGSFANLKTALTNFSADIGHYPHAGCASAKSDATFYANVSACGLGGTVEDNVLLSDTVASTSLHDVDDWARCGLSGTAYTRRWKGPYMDGDPEDFMIDAWGNPVKYGVYKKTIFFHSSGADGGFDNAANIIGCSDYKDTDGDDICVVVARTRKSFGNAVVSSALPE